MTSEFITNLDYRDNICNQQSLPKVIPRHDGSSPGDHLSRFATIFNVHFQCHKEHIPFTKLECHPKQNLVFSPKLF